MIEKTDAIYAEVTDYYQSQIKAIEKVIKLAKEVEREECAAIADQHSSPLVASKIRARNNEP